MFLFLLLLSLCPENYSIFFRVQKKIEKFCLSPKYIFCRKLFFFFSTFFRYVQKTDFQQSHFLYLVKFFTKYKKSLFFKKERKSSKKSGGPLHPPIRVSPSSNPWYLKGLDSPSILDLIQYWSFALVSRGHCSLCPQICKKLGPLWLAVADTFPKIRICF